MAARLRRPDAGAEAAEPHTLLWIGSTHGMERQLVERAGVAYRGIDTGQLRVNNPLTAVVNAGKMVRGLGQSLAAVDHFRPHVCFVTGGYVCAPVVLACRLRRVPVLIYLPDMVPGWAIRWLSRLAQRVAVTFPAAAAAFGGEVPQGKAVVTGYPVRAELVQAARDRQAARQTLARLLSWPELAQEDGLPLLLIWGGSLGARSINQATWQGVAELLPHARVLHIVGQRDWPLYQEWARDQWPPTHLSPEWTSRYRAVPYLHEEMAYALAAADLSVARAGASTLGEFPVARLPSVLVPLPIAGVNQARNAQELVRHGAAVMLEDGHLTDRLVPTLLALLADPQRRQAMAEALARLARPDAACAIARELGALGRAGT
ncbi:MAG: UDP-N-acetylglucosamine--N-acetylmuramyl-(pentapeptide) pyrophosphoryl-undecaprenol N-acetylglucosamine transferase [Litorilinea sp.]|nr:MAG: UDP-N-acetylglucosamine--N-acetylmuramyl-(pentapeptide) pyrophosphoryl-undecaprenol N-acetylglucosamine transferase [Litorilinea sp.]